MADYEISWSPIARLSYISILEYLHENWPEKVTIDFIARTEEVIKYISLNPQLYPFSKEIDVYRCVVVKQVSLFYRVKSNTAELLVFWDNRQDLAKLMKLI
jgi:plasmid stabilization system protein ParE